MGYVLLIGNCFVCGSQFSYNPIRVPSILDDRGLKCPVCKSCADTMNEYRLSRGLSEIVIHDDAYDACDENELPESEV